MSSCVFSIFFIVSSGSVSLNIALIISASCSSRIVYSLFMNLCGNPISSSISFALFFGNTIFSVFVSVL